jgi:DNA polymerase-3 subunit delta'
MRALVQLAARHPATGRYQIVIIGDADRLTERAANALLKAVEEPSEQTVFLLCAPSDHPDDVPITIRSRCRVVPLHSPPVRAIAAVLAHRDGIDPATAEWAASVCGGHIGRARHLAADADARSRRERVLGVPLGLRGLGDAFAAAEELDRAAKSEAADLSDSRDAAEREELAVAMGAGGVGKGVAAAARSARAAEKSLERQQRSRATRTQRDVLDLALIDLAGFFRDVLVAGAAAQVPLTSPDRAGDVQRAAREWTPESALRRLEAVLACREALDRNVKPLVALEAMLVAVHQG